LKNKTISSSLEDYLETIYFIYQEKKGIKAVDIARRLGVNKSSVTEALRALSERKLLNYAPYEVITLTREGEKTAKEIALKHKSIFDFLTRILGVETEEAMKNACRVEHVISDDVLNKLITFMEFNREFHCDQHNFIEEFKDYCRNKNL